MGLKKYDAKRMRRRYPRKYSKNLDLAGFHYGAHAYAVTAAGAEKILRRQSPISMAADNVISMMCIENSIKALRVKNRVFHQNRKLPTTIKNRYQNRDLGRNKRGQCPTT
jgi:glycosyl transferase family 25